VLDSLQLTADYKVATPVNWKDGEDVIIVPAVSDDEAKEPLPEGLQGASSRTCGSPPSPTARRRRLLDYVRKNDVERYRDIIGRLGLRR
jgi:hypothetical protein